tara:strand:+ start:4184 stop:4600 length:417 start_codon:yes stop_codon:yes gene_type:complete
MTIAFPNEFWLGATDEMMINYNHNESLYLRFDKSYVFQFEGYIDYSTKPSFSLYDKDGCCLYKNDMTNDSKEAFIWLNHDTYTLEFLDYDMEHYIGFNLLNSNNEIAYNLEFTNSHNGWYPRFLRFYNGYKCLFKNLV